MDTVQNDSISYVHLCRLNTSPALLQSARHPNSGAQEQPFRPSVRVRRSNTLSSFPMKFPGKWICGIDGRNCTPRQTADKGG